MRRRSDDRRSRIELIDVCIVYGCGRGAGADEQKETTVRKLNGMRAGTRSVTGARPIDCRTSGERVADGVINGGCRAWRTYRIFESHEEVRAVGALYRMRGRRNIVGEVRTIDLRPWGEGVGIGVIHGGVAVV